MKHILIVEIKALKRELEKNPTCKKLKKALRQKQIELNFE